MQLKLNTYHCSIQWNSMVMQVKKVAFWRMGSGGRSRTENRWDILDAGQSAPQEVYLTLPR
jgi:hypothetical protein